MIKDLIKNAINNINKLDDNQVIKTITQYNLKVGKPLFEKLSAKISKKAHLNNKDAASFSPEKIAEFYAQSQKNAIRTIPEIVTRILCIIDRHKCTPEEAIALYSVLLYLIKEDDIISDNMKDGIGYLDDAFVIYTLFQSQHFINILNPGKQTRSLINYYWNILHQCFREVIHEKLNRQAGMIWRTFHKLLMVPVDKRDQILQKIEHDPKLIDQILGSEEYVDIKVPDITILTEPVDPAVYHVFLANNSADFDPFSTDPCADNDKNAVTGIAMTWIE